MFSYLIARIPLLSILKMVRSILQGNLPKFRLSNFVIEAFSIFWWTLFLLFLHLLSDNVRFHYFQVLLVFFLYKRSHLFPNLLVLFLHLLLFHHFSLYALRIFLCRIPSIYPGSIFLWLVSDYPVLFHFCKYFDIIGLHKIINYIRFWFIPGLFF